MDLKQERLPTPSCSTRIQYKQEIKPTRTPKSEIKIKLIPKPKTTHPSVAVMVNEAIETLNKKGGTSVMAIKKYMAAHFFVEPDKLTPFIKKYLAKAVENNILLQATGKGLAGSYKLVAKQGKKEHVTASGDPKVKKTIKKSSSKTRNKSVVKKASGQSIRLIKKEKVAA